MMNRAGQLTDGHGRPHTTLRISVTDRCNIRCRYCMPAHSVRYQPRDELLTFEEIERFVRAVAAAGIHRLRITGGEPLMRADLPVLIKLLDAVPGVSELAMTTNGTLLDEQAIALRQAGLQRVNISLDALNDQAYLKLSRRTGLRKVLDGITAAQHAGFTDIRLNAVAIRGFTETEIVPLVDFARQRRLALRFIEFMPLDAEGNWHTELLLTGAAVRDIVEREFGKLIPLPRTEPGKPAVDYQFADGHGRIGFIDSVSHSFCAECNRLRITAEGQLRHCLFATEEWDVRGLLRAGASDQQLVDLVRECLLAKKAGRGADTFEFPHSRRAMYQLGG